MMRFGLIRKETTKMEKFNLIQRVLERNNYGNSTVLLNKTLVDYIQEKMQCEKYKLSIEAKTIEITDETVWMKFTRVIDHEEEVDFITDIYIAPTDKECAVIEGKNLKPAVYKAEYEEYLWQEDYFVYDNKLIAILAVGNAEICFTLCDIPESMKHNITPVYDNPAKLSRAEVKTILGIMKSM